MINNRQKQFQEQLLEFPQPAQRILQSIPRQAGRLFARQCTELIQRLEIDLEQLMTRLLPLAKAYAVVPVSGFQVGAVALADTGSNGGPTDLFLGANIEFMHQPLNQSIHAEQSAALHAWHQGAQFLRAIATSEPPCGYCRQFLYEFEKSAQMTIITPDGENGGYRKEMLSDLLMATEKSYAPYTRNVAGCGLQTSTGKIFKGRCVESAAFNPSLTALHSAILCLNMATFEAKQTVQRVVLVERPTKVSQRRAAELLLESWAPEIDLEYYTIEEG
jgi:cytidine deaminase